MGQGAEVTMTATLIQLAPVIIGGLLAIGGAFAGTFLTYYLKNKNDERALKRDKLEQILLAANEAEHWLDEYKNKQFLKNEKDIGASPISKVNNLSTLYVPELKHEVSAVSLASAKYFKLIAECQLKRIETGKIPDYFIEKYTPIIKELIASISKLVAKAGTIANNL